MAAYAIETDYLVVGCGAAGMAFTDALIAASDAQVVMVDRRHAPGGHWNDAYPFVRLHQPSSLYGVNSLPLGSQRIDREGLNRGFYELAGAAEIRAYYDRVMRERLLPSGQVRYFPMSEWLGGNRFVSRLSGDEHEVKVRRRLVDATYLESSVPASFDAPFEVAPEARCVPVGELVDVAERADGYVLVGAGKTAMDACLWLLEQGVPPEHIRWIKPREAWLLNRAFYQGGEQVGTMFEGFSLQLEAVAQAESPEDLFGRLVAAGQLYRVDESVTPTMYRGATVTAAEVEELRRVDQVVRLGHVRRIERDAVVLDEGTVATAPGQVHVHCAAPGLKVAPLLPVFTDERITLQAILPGFLSFNPAFAGYVEATRDDPAEKNRLCAPVPLPARPLDWLTGTLGAMKVGLLWSQEADIREWLRGARVYWRHNLHEHELEPRVQEAQRRFADNLASAFDNVERLAAPVAA